MVAVDRHKSAHHQEDKPDIPSVLNVEMVSRDSSSAQADAIFCLSFSIVAFISFASFIYHGHSGAEAPFSFSFIKLCLIVWYLSLSFHAEVQSSFLLILFISSLDSHVPHLGTHNTFSLSFHAETHMFLIQDFNTQQTHQVRPRKHSTN